MEKGIFRFILKHSLRDQVKLVLMSAAALPFLYLTLELPKIIVNDAIGGQDFPRTIFGHDFTQIPFLLLLCGLFLVLVVVSGAMKFVTATYRYRVGDRLLRRLRYDLIERLLRFPPGEFRNLSSGQVVSMITAETANLGFFIAEAFAVPAVAIGTLATIVLFMFMQDWLLGVAAIALYPLQIYLIPRIQRQINTLQRQEVQEQRGVSQRIGDLVAGVSEIHGHDTAQYELAEFSKRLGRIYRFRTQVSSKRYLANVLNQFFSQLTPFFFLSIGGYLVIVGDITLGALVAVLAAYKDMYAPWKDLIDYYQKAEDARVRYGQLEEYFARGTLLEKSMIEAEPRAMDFSGQHLVVSNAVVEKDEGVRLVDGASILLELPTHTAILGSGGSGREEFAGLLARQVIPRSGNVSLGGSNLTSLPDSVTGRRIGFAGSHTHLGTGTLRELLTYPLLRRPAENGSAKPSPDGMFEQGEAVRAGNSPHVIDVDWIDYVAAGCADAEQLRRRMIEVLSIVDLDQDVYEIGLRRAISPAEQPELAARLIEARAIFRQRLHDAHQDRLIETFEADAWNAHASLAENVLFGTPVGDTFDIDNLANNDYMRQVLDRTALTDEFLEMGRRLAAIKAEIFHDLPPDHAFFERFSFIQPEDLPAIEAALRTIESRGIDGLDEFERRMLLGLPFKLIEARHPVDLIDDALKQRLLAARRIFAQELPDLLRGAVQFFDADSYNAASSIIDNILFGKAVSGKAGSLALIDQMVSDIIDELDLRDAVITTGLEYHAGVNGARLSAGQRQKIALARCLIKRPDILILSDALSNLDLLEQSRIVSNVKLELKGRSLILFESDETHREYFEQVLRMDQGRFLDPRGTSSGTAHHRDVPSAPVLARASRSGGGLNDVVRMLSDIPLFAGIDRSKLKLLAFTSERVSFEAGQEVFRQGDSGDRAYVVVEGQLDVVLESTAGARTVATLGSNEIFGEMALLSNMPRTTTIRARTPVVLVSLGQDVFLPLVRENGEIAIAMLRVITDRLASTLRDYGSLVGRQQPESPATREVS